MHEVIQRALMTRTTYKILLVEPNPALVELLVASLSRRFDAYITCVARGDACLDVELLDPHDLVIAESSGAGTPGLELASQLASLGRKPLILLANDLSAEDVVAALRLGVHDVFEKPFPMGDLLDSAERALRERQTALRRVVKYNRMRNMVRQVIRERRDLNRRVELVCRDLVGAHRRLVHRVVGLQKAEN